MRFVHTYRRDEMTTTTRSPKHSTMHPIPRHDPRPICAHMAPTRRSHLRTFGLHCAVSQDVAVWHATWEHYHPESALNGQDFNDGPPRVIGQDGEYNAIPSNGSPAATGAA